MTAYRWYDFFDIILFLVIALPSLFLLLATALILSFGLPPSDFCYVHGKEIYSYSRLAAGRFVLSFVGLCCAVLCAVYAACSQLLLSYIYFCVYYTCIYTNILLLLLLLPLLYGSALLARPTSSIDFKKSSYS